MTTRDLAASAKCIRDRIARERYEFERRVAAELAKAESLEARALDSMVQR